MQRTNFNGYFPRDAQALEERFGFKQGFDVMLGTPLDVRPDQREVYENVRAGIQRANRSCFALYRAPVHTLLRDELDALVLDLVIPNCKVLVADGDSSSPFVGQMLVRAYDLNKSVLVFSKRESGNAARIHTALRARGERNPYSICYETADSLESVMHHLVPTL